MCYWRKNFHSGWGLHQTLLLAMAVTWSLALVGCEPPDSNGHSHDHGHSHGHEEEGPHDGHLIKLNDEYQAEWTHEEGRVTVYVLDAAGAKEVPIAADKVTFSMEKKEGDKQSFDLPAVEATGDPPMATKFELVNEVLEHVLTKEADVETKLTVTLDGKPVSAEVEHHDHDHHGHNH